MRTLSLEKHWTNPKTDLVDRHRMKNGQRQWPQHVITLSGVGKIGKNLINRDVGSTEGCLQEF